MCITLQNFHKIVFPNGKHSEGSALVKQDQSAQGARQVREVLILRRVVSLVLRGRNQVPLKRGVQDGSSAHGRWAYCGETEGGFRTALEATGDAYTDGAGGMSKLPTQSGGLGAGPQYSVW